MPFQSSIVSELSPLILMQNEVLSFKCLFSPLLTRRSPKHFRVVCVLKKGFGEMSWEGQMMVYVVLAFIVSLWWTDVPHLNSNLPVCVIAFSMIRKQTQDDGRLEVKA